MKPFWRKNESITAEVVPPVRAETGIERMEREALEAERLNVSNALAAKHERKRQRIAELEKRPEVVELDRLRREVAPYFYQSHFANIYGNSQINQISPYANLGLGGLMASMVGGWGMA